jgi:hypothetical protein
MRIVCLIALARIRNRNKKALSYGDHRLYTAISSPCQATSSGAAHRAMTVAIALVYGLFSALGDLLAFHRLP